MSQGLWKIEAISRNCISDGNMKVWNESSYNVESSISFGDKFQINMNLNDTISLTNTQINCTILYPNNSIFFQNSKEPSSYYNILIN